MFGIFEMEDIIVKTKHISVSPPAPKKGHSMYYDYELEQWVFVKKN